MTDASSSSSAASAAAPASPAPVPPTPPRMAATDRVVIDAQTRPWWDAAAEGRFLLRHCNACDAPYWYPRPFCPDCWSTDVTWIEASGRGTVYTWSVVHQNDVDPFDAEVPYVVAMVDLAEGPRVATRLVDVGPDEVAVGLEVTVVYRRFGGGRPIPVFTPRGARP